MNRPKSLQFERYSPNQPLTEMGIQTESLIDPKTFIRSPPPLRVAKTDSGQMFKIDQNKGDVDDLSEGESVDLSEELSDSEEEQKISSRNETVKCAPFSMFKQDLTESTKVQGFLNNWIRGSPDIKSKNSDPEGRISRTPGLRDRLNDSLLESYESDLDRSQCVENEMKKRFEKLVMVEKMSMQERFGKKIGIRRY